MASSTFYRRRKRIARHFIKVGEKVHKSQEDMHTTSNRYSPHHVQEILNGLVTMARENDVWEKINYGVIIEYLISRNTRRIVLSGRTGGQFIGLDLYCFSINI